MIWGLVACISRFKDVQPKIPECKEAYLRDGGPVTRTNCYFKWDRHCAGFGLFASVFPCSVVDCTCVQLFASSTRYMGARVPTVVETICKRHL